MQVRCTVKPSLSPKGGPKPRMEEMRSEQCCVVLVRAFVVVVFLTFGFAVGTPPHAPTFGAIVTAAAQDASAVEALLGLDRLSRRLIQQGLRNEGFDPGTPDGLFGPRTREAIRRWQDARGSAATGYLGAAEAELLRAASAPVPGGTEAGKTTAPVRGLGSNGTESTVEDSI